MTATAPPPSSPGTLTPGLTLLFAAASGLCVANIYLAQPLLDPISSALGLSPGLAGLLMSLTQIGYGVGMLLLVPLSDVIENRRLVLITMGGAVAGLFAAALAQTALAFLAASFAVGVCAVAAQVLVPLASHLAPEATRGKVVGNVMAGLIAGIMLARPFASLVAGAFGWRAVFVLSGLLLGGLAVVIGRRLPQRRPPASAGYLRILRSLPGIVADTPLLRRRAIYQGLLFAVFQAFWTAVPLMLAREFGMGQNGIAVFALVGAAGALSAPVVGRMADRGWTRAGTGGSMATVLVAAIIGAVSVHRHSLAGLVVSALLIDGAAQACNVLSLRSLYMLAPGLRGRLNALYLTFMFACAALASGSAAALYHAYGWDAIGLLTGGLTLLALAAFATEFGRPTRSA